MSDFLDALERRVLLLDGAMGTQIQGRELSVETDFWGQENCSEVLNLARPDLDVSRSTSAISRPAPMRSRPTASAARR